MRGMRPLSGLQKEVETEVLQQLFVSISEYIRAMSLTIRGVRALIYSDADIHRAYTYRKCASRGPKRTLRTPRRQTNFICVGILE